MSDQIHVRCGGVLVEEWQPRSLRLATGLSDPQRVGVGNVLLG